MVRVRGVDHHDFVTNPPLDATVTVTQPPNNPPGAGRHGDLRRQHLRLRRPDLDRREPDDADLLVELRQRDRQSGSFVSRTYTSAATYTVTLTLRDEYNVTATCDQTVTITEPPGNVAPDRGDRCPDLRGPDVQLHQQRLDRPQRR